MTPEPLDLHHEARKSLAVISAYAEILSDGLAGPVVAEQREYLSTIVQRVELLDALLDRLPTQAEAPTNHT